MRGSWNLGKIAGIGIYIHWTFIILIAFILFSGYRQGQDAGQLLWTIVFVMSIFVTVFLHELGHALAARKYHIKTRDITLLPIGGLARLERIPEKPKEELVVALAGPLVNILIAVLTALFISFPQTAAEASAILEQGINAGNFFLNFFMVNIWLSVFNLIPAFPMDGGRVLRAFLSMNTDRLKATGIAVRIGQLLAIGFVFAGFYLNPFLIFIGLFIILGAQAELESVRTGHFLRGNLLSEITMRQFEILYPDDTVSDAVKKILNGPGKSFLVWKDDQPVGTLNRESIIKALSEKGGLSPVEHVMNRDFLKLEDSIEVNEALRMLTETKQDLAAVYRQGVFTGVIDTENILELIMIKDALTANARK